MSDYAAYHDRLINLVQDEIARLGYSRAEFAATLEYSPQAVSNWLNRKLQGELSPGAIAALAEYFKCDRAALQDYLRTGEWPEVRSSPTLEDRVEELEATVKKLARQSAEYTILSADWSMPPLAMAMQDAINAKGLDWRNDATIRDLHGILTKPESEGGCGHRKQRITLHRLRCILFGVSDSTDGEDPIVAHAMWKFTDDRLWTPEYVRGLAEGTIDYQAKPQSNGAKGKSPR